MATKEKELVDGCFSRVDLDEPVFVLRAQDKLAPAMVRIWAELADLSGVAPAKTDEAKSLSYEMEEWQAENPRHVKIPD